MPQIALLLQRPIRFASLVLVLSAQRGALLLLVAERRFAAAEKRPATFLLLLATGNSAAAGRVRSMRCAGHRAVATVGRRQCRAAGCVHHGAGIRREHRCAAMATVRTAATAAAATASRTETAARNARIMGATTHRVQLTDRLRTTADLAVAMIFGRRRRRRSWADVHMVHGIR